MVVYKGDAFLLRHQTVPQGSSCSQGWGAHLLHFWLPPSPTTRLWHSKNGISQNWLAKSKNEIVTKFLRYIRIMVLLESVFFRRRVLMYFEISVMVISLSNSSEGAWVASDFGLGHDFPSPKFKPCVRFCADSSESGACFIFCVSLSLSLLLPHSHSISK